ncbi:MAG: hypothetical protein ACRENQ_01210 [Gemmatimonadaceae bacterium]
MLEFGPMSTHRRGFLARLGGAVGLVALSPARLFAEPPAKSTSPELEAWFNRITGKHRMVFDVPGANGGMPVIWPRVYLSTMDATYGTTDDTAVVILRHEAAPLALGDAMWAKYQLGKRLKVDDHGHPATRNVYAAITGLPFPSIGVVELLKTGVLVGVCNVALTMLAGSLAGAAGASPDVVKQELVASIYPGIQIVPSGLMAVGRTQEHGCNYCFAG